MSAYGLAFGIRVSLLQTFLEEGLRSEAPVRLRLTGSENGFVVERDGFSLSVEAEVADGAVRFRIDEKAVSSALANEVRIALSQLSLQLPHQNGVLFGGFRASIRGDFFLLEGTMLSPASGVGQIDLDSVFEANTQALASADAFAVLDRNALTATVDAAVLNATGCGGGSTVITLGDTDLAVTLTKSDGGSSPLEASFDVTVSGCEGDDYVRVESEEPAKVRFQLCPVAGDIYLSLANGLTDAKGFEGLGAEVKATVRDVLLSLAPRLLAGPSLSLETERHRTTFVEWVEPMASSESGGLFWAAKARSRTLVEAKEVERRPKPLPSGVAVTPYDFLYAGAKAGDQLTGGVFVFNVYKQAGSGSITQLTDTELAVAGTYNINQKIQGQDIVGSGAFTANLVLNPDQTWTGSATITGTWSVTGKVTLVYAPGPPQTFTGSIFVESVDNSIVATITIVNSTVYLSLDLEPTVGLLPTLYFTPTT